MKQYFLSLVLCGGFSAVLAQGLSPKAAITYEELYDDPYAINKLFLHIQPLYAELSATNVTAGFGIGANYYIENKADFHVNFRRAYTQSFDLARDAALKNQVQVNEPSSFTYAEIGGTYHIQDFEDDTETKLTLYSRKYQKGNRWAAHVPEHTVVPSKVRKIRGVRLGGYAFDTSLDLQRIAEEQAIVLEDGQGTFPLNAYLHTNQMVKGFFIGGAMSWFKKYGDQAGQRLLGTGRQPHADHLRRFYAGPQHCDGRRALPRSNHGQHPPTLLHRIGSHPGLGLSPRGGMAKITAPSAGPTGAEAGIRPGVKGQGFFAMLKISLPVYSTSLNYRREAFGK